MSLRKPAAEARARRRRYRPPRTAVIMDTVIAVIFCAAGIYHFTQPNRAWRSGTIEVVCAALVMAAAYVAGRTGAIVIHIIVALGIGALGTRHLISWLGWKSGVTEIFLGVILAGIALAIYRDRPR